MRIRWASQGTRSLSNTQSNSILTQEATPMLNETVQRTYIYNGHGHALSGHITRPFDHQIEVQAGMSLPTTGGVGQSRVENFRFREYVSFSAAYTYVAGSKRGRDTYTTLVTSVVEN